MSKRSLFSGAGVALITPMYPDGRVNFDKYRELIDRQIANGTDAIIAVGTTGEAPALADDEHLKLIETAVRQAAGRVPVIAGTGSNDNAHAIMMSREAKARGADGLLLVTPYYNKTSQRGLVAHFQKIADSVDLPMILYNVPSRTGVNMLPQTVATLAAHPNIVAVKEASGSLSAVAQIAALCDIDIYSGNDDQILPVLSLGGRGVISVLSNVVPQVVHDICAKWFVGDTLGSRELALHWLKLANALFMDVNPIPTKDAMNMMGLEVGECRLPLLTMDEAHKTSLREILREYKLV